MKFNFNLFSKNEVKEEKISFSNVPFYRNDDQISFKINKAKDIYLFGDSNSFPDKLIELASTSALHNGIVRGKAKMIAGTDIQLLNPNPSDKEQIAYNVFKQNGDGDDIPELIKNVAFDLTLFGSAAIKVSRSMDLSRIIELEHVPVQNVRLSIDEKSFYVGNWSERRTEATPYPKYSKGNKVPHSIIYIKNKYPNWIYGCPDYIGGIKYIESSIALADYYYSSAKNGFTPSVVINWPIMPDDDRMEEIRNNLEKNFTNKGSGTKLLNLFANGQEQLPQITPLNVNNLDQQMVALQNNLDSGILVSHSITSPELVGISIPGQLGTGDFAEKNELFQKHIIIPQRLKIENKLNQVLSEFDDKIKIKIK